MYAAPSPSPHPVESSIDEIALGSVVEPTADAVVSTDGVVAPEGVSEAEATASGAPSTAESQPPSESPAPPTPEAAPPSAVPGEEPEGASPSATPTDEPVQPEAPDSTTDEDVVSSGAELTGVPALTVSDDERDTFASVGVTWLETPSVEDVVVQIRVQHLDGAWGEWTALEPDDIEQQESVTTPSTEVRAGTAPYWTGDATGVEAVVQGRDGAVPEDVRVTLIDPGTSAADDLASTAPLDQANAAMAMPAVITRAQWGADERIMNWDPEYAPTIKAATLHHTADGNNYGPDDVARMMRSIQAFHSVSRGWGDIGYNVIVDKFGRIYEGRYGGLSSTVVGAHAGGFNTSTFGVSMLGNYDTAQPPQAMVNAVSAIIAWKFSLYGVNPNGTTVLTSGGGGTSRYAAGARVTLPTIFGHRDVGSTACPGQYGYARLGEIRAAVAGRAGNESFVRALYQDMMVRTPDPNGLGDWTSKLTGGGWSTRGVASAFSNSTEFRMLTITQAYQQVFNRAPDPGGMNTWLQYLASGAVRIDTLRPTLMASQEFYLRGGSSDSAFVNNIYQAALNRGADTWEINYWANVRRTSGPAPVIAAVWGSAEAGMRRVDQTYQYYLGRPAARGEQEFWLPVLMGSGDEQLRQDVMSSMEYFLRGMSRFPG
ncbi:DUF4214 domain-containing protein [Geodermatophilus sp. Leaf369]|uniref:DUF4214 domain-containing protein n=1 Tax=Geodermatophilus sp. Leaf369 TaxID=1736354 RepID=UPI001F2315BF|nr:DUF4214 domain-containing protein [Geodermatophilus sp. Leaf369]